MAKLTEVLAVVEVQFSHVLACGFERRVVVAEGVAERKHEIGRIAGLVGEADLVEAADAFFVVEMLVGFDGKGEFLPRSALGVKGSDFPEFEICRAGLPVSRPIKIAGIGIERLQIGDDGRFWQARERGSLGCEIPRGFSVLKFHLNDLTE